MRRRKRRKFYVRNSIFRELPVYLILFFYVLGAVIAVLSYQRIASNSLIQSYTSVFFREYSGYFGAVLQLIAQKAKLLIAAALLSMTVFGVVAIPSLSAVYGFLSSFALMEGIANAQKVLIIPFINLVDAALFIPLFFFLSTFLIELSLNYAGLIKKNTNELESKHLQIPVKILKLLGISIAAAIFVSFAQAPLLLIK